MEDGSNPLFEAEPYGRDLPFPFRWVVKLSVAAWNLNQTLFGSHYGPFWLLSVILTVPLFEYGYPRFSLWLVILWFLLHCAFTARIFFLSDLRLASITLAGPTFIDPIVLLYGLFLIVPMLPLIFFGLIGFYYDRRAR